MSLGGWHTGDGGGNSSDPPKKAQAAAGEFEATRKIKLSQTESIENRLPEQFEIIETIAKGGMGVVYKARNRFTDQIVAIKMLNAGSHDPEAILRFQREGKAACAFHHQNAVAVYDFGSCADGSPYFVMEYVDGQDLGTMLRQTGKLDERLVTSIARTICEVLVKAHAQGVVHRDLKPSNVILQKDENGDLKPKILDFGIAKFIESEDTGSTQGLRAGAGEQKLTSTGRLLGTPLYMSPEQCTEGIIDARSDIYSLGALLYHLLTGVPPHQGASSLETMSMKTTAQPPRFSQHGIKVSTQIESVVRKCLETSPDDRFQSASELLAALRTIKRVSKSAGKSLQVAMILATIACLLAVASAGGYYFYACKQTNRKEIEGDQALKEKNFALAADQYKQALDFGAIANLHKSNQAVGKVYGKLAQCLDGQGLKDEAVSYREQQLKWAISYGNSTQAMDAETGLEDYYFSKGKWARLKALYLDHMQRLEALPPKTNSEKDALDSIYLHLGDACFNLHDLDSAQKWAQKVITYAHTASGAGMYDKQIWAWQLFALIATEKNDAAGLSQAYEKLWEVIQLDPYPSQHLQQIEPMLNYYKTHGRKDLADQINAKLQEYKAAGK